MRSIIDYAVPVFHYALPAYLMQELECVQKRAMWITCPSMEYQHALVLANLSSVAEHHSDICKSMLESIFNDSGHKLRKLLAPHMRANTILGTRDPSAYCTVNKQI